MIYKPEFNDKEMKHLFKAYGTGYEKTAFLIVSISMMLLSIMLIEDSFKHFQIYTSLAVSTTMIVITYFAGKFALDQMLTVKSIRKKLEKAISQVK